ncbi:glycoside hydrolase family 5 protein [Lepidopterella palustris CBS 459.81]|uniref:Endoglucanase EG-II n=1 Tax=Lepidopterella palustris CBS 459.81 TaxID=1314670 RepID=A0A8E2DYH2_9PEZI|nr:glycoside hydrolase family 5 protein [Lepidopterella palustris CBS 459.81]
MVVVAACAGMAVAQQTVWGQCAGINYSGSTACTLGTICVYINNWYSQCQPRTTATTPASANSSYPTASANSSCYSTVITSSTITANGPATSPSPSSGKVTYAGVNIAGFDFGCGTDGTCVVSGADDIVTNSNAVGQMEHFAKDDGLNAFRLPVGWQFLVNGVVGAPLNATNFGKYDKLVQGCLGSGAEMCIVDIHNYARWNGKIVGQGGPSNADLASVWSQLAIKYASENKIVFGIMNEPHNIPDIWTWADTIQASVTAIRQAGATSQMILLPGNNYSGAASFVSSGSAAALAAITNLDLSTTNLIFDVHKYLDDGSGTSITCKTNNIDSTFRPLASWLRQNKRMVFNSETGGGNTDSCYKYLCEQIQFLNQNADVFLGYTSWAAGGFSSGYALNEVPTLSGGTWTDQLLVSKCVVGAWK